TPQSASSSAPRAGALKVDLRTAYNVGHDSSLVSIRDQRVGGAARRTLEANVTMRSLLLGTAAAVSLCGVAEAAPFHGWYLSMEGGAVWVQKDDFTNHSTTGTFHNQYSFETGWAVLASVGYAFDRHWRVEGEAGYRSNRLDQFFNNTTSFTT